jgi:hypothetical protein
MNRSNYARHVQQRFQNRSDVRLRAALPSQTGERVVGRTPYRLSVAPSSRVDHDPMHDIASGANPIRARTCWDGLMSVMGMFRRLPSTARGAVTRITGEANAEC